MKEKLKGTHKSYAETGTANGKAVIFLKYPFENITYTIAYIYKHDRTRLHIICPYSVKFNATVRRSLALFINEYGTYIYEGEIKRNLAKCAFFAFLNKEYGFNFEYKFVRKLKKDLQKDLTGLNT